MVFAANLNVAGASPNGQRRWPLFLGGFILFLLGPAIYALQIWLGKLGMPWHVPILASMGVLLMACSVLQRGGIIRGLGLALFIVLCGLEWMFVLVLSRTPAYAGPVERGQKLPAFATTLADGRAFTDDDLTKGDFTMMVFYRGRW